MKESDTVEVLRSDPSIDEPLESSHWTEPKAVEHNQMTDLPVKWTPQMEIALFQAMGKNKPVGIHKHFLMANIIRLYNSNSPVKCNSQDIWDYLDRLFHLSSLDEMENLSESEWGLPLKHPFRSRDFFLPSYDFEELVQESHLLPQLYHDLRESSPSLSIATSGTSTPEPKVSIKKIAHTNRDANSGPKSMPSRRGRVRRGNRR